MVGLVATRGARVRGAWAVKGLAALAIVGLALPLTATGVGASPSVTEVASVSSDGYIALGANGNVDLPNYITGLVYQVTPDGTVTTAATLAGYLTGGPWSATGDASGNVYVALYYSGVIEKITPGGAVSVYASGSELDSTYGMVETSSGVLDVLAQGNLYSIPPSGVVTLIASGLGEAGLAVDQAGNAYSASEGTTVYETTPGGTTRTLATIPGAQIYSVAGGPSGDVYAADYSGGSIYQITPDGAVTTAVTHAELGGGPTPFSLAFDPSGDLYASALGGPVWKITGVGATATPRGLIVTEASGEVSASWYGASGASYTCTLMYGFNDPSEFHETTTTPSCTFQGLDTTVAYGIEVVANNGSSSSAPAVGFASAVPTTVVPPAPHKHSIVCRKNHGGGLRAVTGVHPACPSGWHRVG
jgi:hypothetical protein